MKLTTIVRALAVPFLTAGIVAGSALGPTANAARHHATAAAKTHALDITLVIKPASRRGPDKVMHDAFNRTDFSVVAGQKVVITVYNYDGGSHSFTAPELKINATFKGAKDGKPSVTVFSFVAPSKAGSYHWLCVLPCDGQARGWAMAHNEFMAGTITVTRA